MTEVQDSFMPDGYEVPQSNSAFLKLPAGETRLRVLSRPVIGWVDWKDNKPMRFPFNKKPDAPVDPTKPIKHFWAMIVFDYTDDCVKIFEITQQTIQAAIDQLAKNEEWGSPTGYDIKITKKGQDKKTEYAVMPSPKKPLSEGIKTIAADKPINLDALLKGGDPFVITNGEQTRLSFQ